MASLVAEVFIDMYVLNKLTSEFTEARESPSAVFQALY